MREIENLYFLLKGINLCTIYIAIVYIARYLLTPYILDAEIEWPIGQTNMAFKDIFSNKERKNSMLLIPCSTM